MKKTKSSEKSKAEAHRQRKARYAQMASDFGRKEQRNSALTGAMDENSIRMRHAMEDYRDERRRLRALAEGGDEKASIALDALKSPAHLATLPSAGMAGTGRHLRAKAREQRGAGARGEHVHGCGNPACRRCYPTRFVNDVPVDAAIPDKRRFRRVHRYGCATWGL